MWVETVKQARRVIIAIVGFTLVALGVAMFITPGPGLVVVALGLTVLGAEFVWARRLLKRLKKTGAEVTASIMSTVRREPAPPEPPDRTTPEDRRRA